MNTIEGTALFNRVLRFDHGDQERNDLMRKVWSVTPWMVDAYTGSIDYGGRYREMMDWCFDQFGQECSPIHDKPGRWQRGSATIFGWTWFGFTRREEMERFVAQWPAPPGIAFPYEPDRGHHAAATEARKSFQRLDSIPVQRMFTRATSIRPR